VIEARELYSTDVNGRADPYCKVKYGDEEKKTHVVKMTLHPVWAAAVFSFDRSSEHVIHFDLWDHDSARRDDFLGRCQFTLTPETRHKETDTWIALDETEISKHKHLKGAQELTTSWPKLGLLHVRIYDGIDYPIPQDEPVGKSIFFFQGYEEHLKTGDCILYSGLEMISSLIKTRFDTPYSHCGMILKMKNPITGEGPEEIYVCEADWDDGDFMEKEEVYGIIVNKFADRMKAYSGSAIWLCPLKEPLSDDENKRVIDLVLGMKKSKVKYGLFTGIKMMAHLGAKNKEGGKAVFCSELVAYAMKQVGRCPDSLNSANAQPYDVAKLDCYEGQFPKTLLRYQVAIDQEKVRGAGFSEILELFK